MLDPFSDVRSREYPDPGNAIYLNAASFGLLPLSAAEAAADLILRRNRGDRFRVPEWPRALWRARHAAADLLRAPVENVALAPNTSFGVNLAAHLALLDGPGTVLLSDGEFPANVFPWLELRRDGFEVEIVPAGPDGLPNEDRLLERAGQPDVRVVALSATQFHTGYRADLRAFGKVCGDREILFAVDGIQALGLDEIHPAELGIDILATGGQKWLCSPWGSGFVYVSDRFLERGRPQVFSWLAYESTQNLEGLLSYEAAYMPDARRFELHTLGVQDFLAHGIALELFNRLTPSAIRRYILDLHGPVLDWVGRTESAVLVTPAEEERRGGILAFRVEGDGQQARVASALSGAGVHFVQREGLVRLAPHFYNTPEQMHRVVEVLDEGLAGA